jgi:hypothetical protein
VAAYREPIEGFYLPAYSPERHPVAYLSHDLKGTVNEASLSEDRGTVYRRIVRCRDQLVNVPQQVIRSFLQPGVQYAAPVELL